MLVNTTIFSEGVEEPWVMVETMIEMLNTSLLCRNPLWMLVNTTIFSEGVEEPRVMVETMIEMLNTLLQVFIYVILGNLQPLVSYDGQRIILQQKKSQRKGHSIKKRELVFYFFIFIRNRTNSAHFFRQKPIKTRS
jgi:hypothetical protein